MSIFKRHFLKKREFKAVIDDFSGRIKVSVDDILTVKAGAEIVEVDGREIIVIDDVPSIVRSGGEIFPTLSFKKIFPHMAMIVVDMGAIPYICNGADVMAPGIVEIKGEFSEGDLVLVVDERNRKAISIGSAIINSEDALRKGKGKVIKNLHFIGDSIWSIIKRL